MRPDVAANLQRFLGTPPGVTSPGEVLGVAPDADAAEIGAAVARQLARIDRHPDGATPDADEARQSVRAAGAALISARIRPQPPDPGPASAPAPPARDAPGITRDEALAVLGTHGGLTPAGVEALATLAAQRGLPPASALDALRAFSPRPVEPARPAAPVRPLSRLVSVAPSIPAYDPDEPPASDPAELLLRRLVAGATIVAGVGVVTLLIVLVALLRGPGSPAGAPPAPKPTVASTPIAEPPARAAPARTETPRRGSVPAPRGAAPDAPADPVLLLRALRGAAEAVGRDDPGADAAQITPALAQLAAHWTRLDPAQLAAANESVIEYLHMGATRGRDTGAVIDAMQEAMRALEPAAAPMEPAGVAPAAWASGLAVRVVRERELPAEMRAALDAALARALGSARPVADGSFQAGVTAALRRAAGRLVPRLERPEAGQPLDGGFARWLEVVNAGYGRDTDAREALIIDALERIARDGPDPSRSRAAYEATTLLTAAASWRESGPARRRLLEWFADQRVATADLAAITAALASRSSAPGVDPSMVLSPGATGEQRAALAERLATAWNLADVAGGQLLEEWRRAADELGSAARARADDEPPAAALVRAVALARLNLAGALRWRADIDEARRALQSAEAAERDLRLPSANRARSLAEFSGGTDGSWAERYLAAEQNIPVRLERIAEIAQSASLGQVDAEVLAEAACFAVPTDVRSAAQDVIGRLADAPAAVNAMLEVLPRAPRIVSVSRTIERITRQPLPHVSDGAWPREARRALVESLLELLAASSDFALADRAASELARAYDAGAAMPAAGPPAGQAAPADPDAPAAASASPPPLPRVAGERLWMHWRAAAENAASMGRPLITLDVLDRRRAGRRSMAGGVVQQFAAEQFSAAEAMAVVVASEQPGKSERIARLLSDLNETRRRAGHIFDQVLSTELAITELWRIRAGVPVEESPLQGGAPAPASHGAPWFAGRPSSASQSDGTPAGIPVQRLEERLSALRPDEPASYFLLGEELVSEAFTPEARDLARTLLVLAMELDRRAPGAAPTLARSCCLALAEVAGRDDDRRWLVALARAVDPGGASIGAAPATTRPVDVETAHALATALGWTRSGEGRRALTLLDQPDVGGALLRYENLLSPTLQSGGAARIRDFAAQWPCRECRNRRVVVRTEARPPVSRLCPTCLGNPGPRLTDLEITMQLRLESVLLSGIQRSWAAQALADGGQTLRELDLAEVAPYYGVDAARPVWRDGAWVAFPGP